MSQPTLSIIAQQNQVFYQAYQGGQISEAEYNMAMQFQRQRVAELARAGATPATTPINIPEGYEVVKKETYVSAPLPPNPAMPQARQTYDPMRPQQEVTEYTMAPTFRDVLLGGNAMLPREITPEEAKQAQEKYLRGEQPFESAEGQAITRLTLATTVATGVAIPIAGAIGLGSVGIAEAAKVGVTGKHLTPEEAVTAGAIGVTVGTGALGLSKMLQPRVQKSVDASFRSAVENQAIWEPSVTQKIGMKVTGVRLPRLAQEIVGAGEPGGVTLSMLQKGQTVGPEESYFWDMPTPKTSQAYVRGYPSSKSWVETTLVKRVYLEGLFTTIVPQRLLLERETTLEPKMPYIPQEPYIVEAAQAPQSLFMPPFVGGLLAAPQTQGLMTRQQTQLRQRQTQLSTPRQELISESQQDQLLDQMLNQELIQGQAQAQIQLQGIEQQQSQRQIQRAQQKQIFAVTPQLTIPSLPRLSLPSSRDWIGGFGLPSSRKMQGYNRYLWEWPVAGPEALGFSFGRKKRRRKK